MYLITFHNWKQNNTKQCQTGEVIVYPLGCLLNLIWKAQHTVLARHQIAQKLWKQSNTSDPGPHWLNLINCDHLQVLFSRGNTRSNYATRLERGAATFTSSRIHNHRCRLTSAVRSPLEVSLISWYDLCLYQSFTAPCQIKSGVGLGLLPVQTSITCCH